MTDVLYGALPLHDDRSDPRAGFEALVDVSSMTITAEETSRECISGTGCVDHFVDRCGRTVKARSTVIGTAPVCTKSNDK